MQIRYPQNSVAKKTTVPSAPSAYSVREAVLSGACIMYELFFKYLV